jgi:hypothetical protein
MGPGDGFRLRPGTLFITWIAVVAISLALLAR